MRQTCVSLGIFGVLLIVAPSGKAARDSGFAAASKEADRNYATAAGRKYRDRFLQAVDPHVVKALGACIQQTPTTAEPAQIIFIIAANGGVKRIVSTPNNSFGECVAARLRSFTLAPPPPYDSWPAAVAVRYDPQEAAGPPDRPKRLATAESLAAYHKAIAPYVAKARASYPAAKKRFLAGLPPGHRFAVRVPLFEGEKREDTFVSVEGIKNGRITGRIANKLVGIANYKTGQRITFPESTIDNWLILRPDGTEEGNHVGKFLDSYKPK